MPANRVSANLGEAERQAVLAAIMAQRFARKSRSIPASQP